MAAEAAAAYLLVAPVAPVGLTPRAALALVLLLHALGAVASVRLLVGAATALGLSRIAPLAAVAAIFVPIVGPFGLVGLLRAVARHARAGVPELPPVITPQPTLPASAPEVMGEALGVGALASRLRFAADSATRVKAVLATRRLEGGRATPLLREALRDRHEDVRLLAYALLEDREQQADATIRRLLAALASAPPSRKAALHDRLANAHWELCYQELVAGELEAFALGQVLEHLNAATAAAGRSTAARWLLRARVLLRRGDAAGARAALQESWRGGMPARTVDTYLAEASFVARARRAGA